MFDTHAHLNFKDFDENRESLIEKCRSEGVGMINIGATLETSKKAVEIAEEKNKMYASAGIHPLHAEEDFDFGRVEKLAENKRVVAIGETGLDKKKKKTLKKQKEVFLDHIELAERENLPLILHSRKAHEETLETIPDYKGIIHCFTGSLSQAKRYIEKGYLIGLNGIIFKLNLKKVIKVVSPKNIVLETDCPYLNPPGWKGKNTPLGVIPVAEEVAKIKGMDVKKLEKITDGNVKRLFGI